MPIRIKRIYEGYNPQDGWRVLVDRIWPRGVSKAAARLDDWRKDLAPSTELRTWFCHKVELFDEFSKRYRAELDENASAQTAIQQILEKIRRGQVTLLYSAKDTEHNQAVVLSAYLNEKASRE
ncbi:MAG TPA: DUF488 domain-containing protein [Anaerolineaceae bacterium]|nr:DUF488 domain-containing protein [Anaerolineaceae bacterium]